MTRWTIGPWSAKKERSREVRGVSLRPPFASKETLKGEARTSSMTRVLTTSSGVVDAAAMAPAMDPQKAASCGSTLRSRYAGRERTSFMCS